MTMIDLILWFQVRWPVGDPYPEHWMHAAMSEETRLLDEGVLWVEGPGA